MATEFPPNGGNGVGGKPSNSLVYPPLDDLMADMRLSDNRPSAPASPPAPSVPSAPSADNLALAYSPSSSGEFSPHGSFYVTHSRRPSLDSCFSYM